MTEQIQEKDLTPLYSPSQIRAMLEIDGFGEQGTEDFMTKLEILRNMADDEVLMKVRELDREIHIGKTVFLKGRSESGVLNDVVTFGRYDDHYLSVNSKIYQHSGYDLVIVKG